MSLNAVTYFLRVAVFVGPVLAFLITKRICVGLQRADAERLLHGSESGIIVRDPSGAYSEGHVPISEGEAYTLTQHVEPMALVPGGDQGDMTDRQYQLEQLRRRATRFYFIDQLRKPTRAELEEAAAHLNHEVEAHSHGHSYPPSDSGHAIGDGHGNGHGNGHGELESGKDEPEFYNKAAH